MKIVDLTQTISPETQVFPAYPRPCFLKWTRREVYGFEAEVMYLAVHTGTHIDAPYHFVEDGSSVDGIEPDRLIGDAVLLDLTQKGVKEYITAQDVARAEERAGGIREGDIVVVMTGWYKRLGEPIYVESYPGLDEGAANYLVSRGVRAVGVDMPSPDHPDEGSFVVHKVLLSRGVLIIENLTNLEGLPSRFRFVGLPMKLRGLSGAPIRAIAII